MSGQWPEDTRLETHSGIVAAEVTDALGQDAFQNLLQMAYQKQQAELRGIHLHACVECGRELTCCCKDRRAKDRVTGVRRGLYCIPCGDRIAGENGWDDVG